MPTATAGEAVAELHRRLKAELHRRGPVAFARYFTPHLVEGDSAPLHEALNDWFRAEAIKPAGTKDAWAAPRGHGKSTTVEVGALWCVAYEVRRFVVICSDTWSQAVERLATLITEIENNYELQTAFPDLRPAIDDFGRVVRWRDDDIILANGCRVMAVGAGKSVRGARLGNQRPDLLIFDDLEDETSVATEASIEKRMKWITRVALGLASPTKGMSALWVGTILSRAALLNLATAAALDEGQTRPEWAQSWRPHVFRAEVDGTPKTLTAVTDRETGKPVRSEDGKIVAYTVGEPMWSEMTRAQLARKRYEIGSLAYAAEYQSDPVDSETTLLAPPLQATYINPQAPPIERLIQLPGGRIVPVAAMVKAAALDPQYTEKRADNSPDLAAIVTAGQYGELTFILDAWIGRDRHGQAARLIDMGLKWGCYAVGVEKVAAQATTADQAAGDGRLPVIPLIPIDSKENRSYPLMIRLGDKEKRETCRVYILPDAQARFDNGTLEEHLAKFPHGRYDDPVDATVYAVDLASRAAQRGGGSGPKSG